MINILDGESSLANSRLIFEKIYTDYNKRVYVTPDPLQYLYDYSDSLDREVVGLIASSLAYGRVNQILKSVDRVLTVLGSSPSNYLKNVQKKDLENKLAGFVHRFTDSSDMVDFLCCIGSVLNTYGSVENLFLSHYRGDTWKALQGFTGSFLKCGGRGTTFLMPDPSRGSACKRLSLYLRWMVRSDEVDPGGWRSVDPAALLIPLDTHMFNICTKLGLCSRKSADGRSVIEITEAFKRVCPEDPVRYDFALTRFGIRDDMTLEELFFNWDKKE